MSTHQPGYRVGEFVGRCDDIPMLDRSRHLAIPNFMPLAWTWGMLSWAQSHFNLMTYNGGATSFQASASMPDLGDACPEAQVLMNAIVDMTEDGCDACAVPVPDESPLFIEAWLSHRGEGDHFSWHTDRDPVSDEEQTRVLAFCYYLHSDPCLFMGGELEFFDGVMVQPLHNTLVMFNPHQMHRVRHVHGVPRGFGGTDEHGDSANDWPGVDLHMIDGRWCVVGWVHRSEPTDYNRRPSARS